MDTDEIVIHRKVFTEKSFKNAYGFKEPTEITLKDKVLNALRPKESDPKQAIKKFIYSVVPILYWLPRYKVKKWLLADIVSGLTIGIMHIPQAMSYALLAGQHPIYGLYTSFLPVILYSILGTSRHTAMGTLALASLLLGNAMASLVPDPVLESEWDDVYDRRILLGSACMFMAGLFLFGLSILRVGFVVIYLSDPMISGFMFGAAVQILVLQFKGLLGVSIGRYSGPLNLIWILRDLFTELANLDDEQKTKTVATVVISIICILFLVILKELNLRYKEKIPLGLPLPGEMIVVVVGTGISYGVDLAGSYGVAIIGNIPSGFPAPVVPALDELSSLIGSAIPIAIVGYSSSISIAKIFGNKFGYEIRPNQELVAYGVSNMVCSFFSCIPAFSAMSRSCVQVESGGKTQVVGLVASVVILLVLLVIGPLFGTIPRACLASIVCVAMKGMLKRALDLKSLWKTSKLDFATWIVVALATIFLDVVYGLCVGIAFTLLCIVFRTQLVEKETLQRVDTTEIYRKMEQYDEMSDNPLIRIGAFRGPLHYVNKDSFRKTLLTVAEIDPVVEFAKRKRTEKKLKKNKEKLEKKEKGDQLSAEVGGKNGTMNTSYCHSEIDTAATQSSSSSENTSHSMEGISSKSKSYVILDCAQIAFMDSVGAKAMATITDDFKKIDVHILLACCSSEVLRILSLSDYFEKFGEDIVFISIHDAVTSALKEIKREQLIRNNTNEAAATDITIF